jgi:hypothetical protein
MFAMFENRRSSTSSLRNVFVASETFVDATVA